MEKLRILLTNVQLPAATKAAEVGVDGIIVSNHGARQLDYAPATISVLEEVIAFSICSQVYWSCLGPISLSAKMEEAIRI